MGASAGMTARSETKPRVFRLFISYAREDTKIAIAVHNALQSALGPSAEVFIDSGLSFGLSFQEEIKKRLDETDTLVVIDSAALKPAYGFTGMELGYFIRAMEREVNRDFPRRIVPVFSERPPDILADHEGIKIEISHSTLSLTLEEYEASLQNIGYDHPTVKFLRDFQGLVDELHEKCCGARIPQSSDQRDLPELVKRMQLAIFSHLKTTPESTLKPQKQITIRTSDMALNSRECELPEDARLIPMGTGNPLSIFGLESVETTWGDFQKNTTNAKFRDCWMDAITSVVTSSLQNQLEVDNSQVIVSNDEKHTYRVILTTGTKYYDGVREFNLYFVEYLRREDFGDHDTTLLLKGLELFCRFRSMFLEHTSEFSSIGCKTARSLTDTARDLERELNLLHRDAMELGLDKPNIWADFVDWSRLEKIIEVWRPLEIKLRESLTQIRCAKADTMESCRQSLVTVLQELETSMRPLNAGAVSEMAQKLTKPGRS
jgi:hypothetical protein